MPQSPDWKREGRRFAGPLTSSQLLPALWASGLERHRLADDRALLGAVGRLELKRGLQLLLLLERLAGLLGQLDLQLRLAGDRLDRALADHDVLLLLGEAELAAELRGDEERAVRRAAPGVKGHREDAVDHLGRERAR